MPGVPEPEHHRNKGDRTNKQLCSIPGQISTPTVYPGMDSLFSTKELLVKVLHFYIQDMSVCLSIT